MEVEVTEEEEATEAVVTEVKAIDVFFCSVYVVVVDPLFHF